jgi:uncharacterized membrane protein SpoIIM required for sporulation
VILDLDRFVAQEQPYWVELEEILGKLEERTRYALDLEGAQRFYYLYQRASADLARLASVAVEPPVSRYLQSLVARAYGEVHEVREKHRAARAVHWFLVTFPRTFRRHVAKFWLAVALTLAGTVFGAVVLSIDSGAKHAIMPFPGLEGDPKDRVASEEKDRGERLSGHKASFSAQLMTHNIQVSIGAMALGLTWGVGTVVMLFYNGVILGAVGYDYIHAGQTPFLLGWLLPHGVIEIPAIILAGQAGLLLASALIGWGKPTTRRARFRETGPDLATLIGGVAMMLVWAGIIEAFVSQYHQPVIPYGIKIAFGVAEFTVLMLFLSRAGLQDAD